MAFSEPMPLDTPISFYYPPSFGEPEKTKWFDYVSAGTRKEYDPADLPKEYTLTVSRATLRCWMDKIRRELGYLYEENGHDKGSADEVMCVVQRILDCIRMNPQHYALDGLYDTLCRYYFTVHHPAHKVFMLDVLYVLKHFAPKCPLMITWHGKLGVFKVGTPKIE